MRYGEVEGSSGRCVRLVRDGCCGGCSGRCGGIGGFGGPGNRADMLETESYGMGVEISGVCVVMLVGFETGEDTASVLVPVL